MVVPSVDLWELSIQDELNLAAVLPSCTGLSDSGRLLPVMWIPFLTCLMVVSLMPVISHDPTMACCEYLPPHNSEGIWILSFWIFIFTFWLKDLFCLLKKAYASPSQWAKGRMCFRVFGRPRGLVCMVDSFLWAFPFLKCIFCGSYRFPLPSLTFTFAWAWCTLQDMKCICLLIKQDTFRCAWPTAFLLV